LSTPQFPICHKPTHIIGNKDKRDIIDLLIYEEVGVGFGMQASKQTIYELEQFG
jgi:hypothetical protein